MNRTRAALVAGVVLSACGHASGPEECPQDTRLEGDRCVAVEMHEATALERLAQRPSVAFGTSWSANEGGQVVQSRFAVIAEPQLNTARDWAESHAAMDGTGFALHFGGAHAFPGGSAPKQARLELISSGTCPNATEPGTMPRNTDG